MKALGRSKVVAFVGQNNKCLKSFNGSPVGIGCSDMRDTRSCIFHSIMGQCPFETRGIDRVRCLMECHHLVLCYMVADCNHERATLCGKFPPWKHFLEFWGNSVWRLQPIRLRSSLNRAVCIPQRWTQEF